MRIALAGNPNSGKTPMYNARTGKNERVGNWTGVTVDKREAVVKKKYAGENRIVAVDLPGAYSMSPFTSEESITSSYVKNEKPDVIVNIVDATNLSRSLFFTTQLLELGIPVVIALNKSDVNKKRQTKIDTKLLGEKLNCPVVETVSTANSDKGLFDIVKLAVENAKKVQKAPYTDNSINLKDKSEAVEADKKRFEFVNKLVAETEIKKVKTNKKNTNDKIDKILTNKIVGILIFALIMFCVFDISQSTLGPFLADIFVGWIDLFYALAEGWLSDSSDILKAILLDGIIGGVGAVVGFLPLVMIMYFLISLLEDCGYMARVSVVLDPIFKKVGLSGRSVIPFVIGTGCAIPGVMACRTIHNERERRATAMLAPFMPCGAKLPVIALFAGAFFDEASWVGTLMYFVGIIIIFFGALLVNRITGNSKKKSFFIIELPEYKIPSIKRAFLSMCSRGWSYVVKAGTVILVCNTAVQIMQSFTWSFVAAEAAEDSILASVANPIAYLLIPIVGVKAWQLAAAAVTGFIAKENVVGTLAVCYVGLENLIDTEELALMEGAGAEVAGVFALTKVAALAYLMFNLFSPPCFAAIGAMNSEIRNKKWMLGGVMLQFAVGYTLGFFVYQIGTVITTGKLGAGFFGGLIAVFVIAMVIIYLIKKADREMTVKSFLAKEKNVKM